MFHHTGTIFQYCKAYIQLKKIINIISYGSKEGVVAEQRGTEGEARTEKDGIGSKKRDIYIYIKEVKQRLPCPRRFVKSSNSVCVFTSGISVRNHLLLYYVEANSNPLKHNVCKYISSLLFFGSRQQHHSLYKGYRLIRHWAGLALSAASFISINRIKM